MNNLNLARKLRPKNFDEIIGQQLSVSMLKNSLYVKKLFPVYLFSGQRGCGKTSTARVFGAAINCQNLVNFQMDAPNNSVPCLTCESCLSMLQSNHPDFIEMDAASHTGVDSVRQIIESCTYMPLSGSKKIYLIDEAHMLSRAAFNAFLKILEEPPSSTIFILATTETHKIPDTVRSRCFQVVFNPVQHTIMLKHLKTICATETITADDDALELLVQENDGSVRDAINTLEQVRFSGEQITKDLVLKSLGKLSDTQLLTLIDAIVDQNPQALLQHIQTIKLETLSPQTTWNMITSLLRSLLWITYGVSQGHANKATNETLQTLAKKCSLNKIHALLQMMRSQEPLFLQTPQKYLFLEMILLQMCQQVNIEDLETLIEFCKNTSHHQQHVPKQVVAPAPIPQTPRQSTQETQPVLSHPNSHTAQNIPAPWTSFVNEFEQTCKDPMVLSIFKQAKIATSDDMTNITLHLSNNSPFLQEKIAETENLWGPIVKKHFTKFRSFAFKTSTLETSTLAPSTLAPSTPAQKKTIITSNPNSHTTQRPSFQKRPFQSTGRGITISNPEKWPKATLLTKSFSGKLEEVAQEGDN